MPRSKSKSKIESKAKRSTKQELKSRILFIKKMVAMGYDQTSDLVAIVVQKYNCSERTSERYIKQA